MANPTLTFPELPPSYGNLRITLESARTHIGRLEAAFPYTHPFTHTALTPNGRQGRSSYVNQAVVELKRFTRWCLAEKLNLAPEHFRPAHFSHYIDFLRNRINLAPSTTHAAIIYIRQFLNDYFAENKLRIPNPILRNLVKIPKRLNTRCITEKQIKMLLQRIGSIDRWSRQKQLVLRMTYDGAARIGEVLNLKFENLKLHEAHKKISGFHVIRKGGKVRDLYISKETKELLLVHLKESFITRAGQPLFPSRFFPDRPMSKATLSIDIKSHLVAMGIRRKIYGTHIFRHSAAKHMIARDADPYVVADYLSHSSIGTTIGTYATPTNIEVARSYRKAMPKFDYRRIRASLKYFEEHLG